MRVEFYFKDPQPARLSAANSAYGTSRDRVTLQTGPGLNRKRGLSYALIST